MLLLCGKSTYPGCSDFQNHLFLNSRRQTDYIWAKNCKLGYNKVWTWLHSSR